MKRAVFFQHAVKRGGQWAGPEAGRPEELLLCWASLCQDGGQGKRIYYALEGHIAEQREKCDRDKFGLWNSWNRQDFGQETQRPWVPTPVLS